MSNTILEKKYEEPDRPFSQKEIEYLREQSHRKLYLSQVLIKHRDCYHFYFAKANGRKEREAYETRETRETHESNQTITGNCSVCWKINRTPTRLKEKAKRLVDEYCNTLHTNPSYWTYDLYNLENDFYTWLYNEFNPKKDSKEKA